MQVGQVSEWSTTYCVLQFKLSSIAMNIKNLVLFSKGVEEVRLCRWRIILKASSYSVSEGFFVTRWCWKNQSTFVNADRIYVVDDMCEGVIASSEMLVDSWDVNVSMVYCHHLSKRTFRAGAMLF